MFHILLVDINKSDERDKLMHSYASHYIVYLNNLINFLQFRARLIF